jgi:2,3-bisphosphoglycerate-dependent phosphoglycerate mutase
MDLLLIRHGLPEHVETVDGGPADPPLAALGHRQAEEMARWLARERIDRLYSSPLRRARETAAALASLRAMDIDLHPGVAEYDRDASEYVPMERLKEVDFERWQQIMRGDAIADFDAFAGRVISALEEIIEANPGRRVAVACHGGVINVWAAHVIGFSPRFFFNPDYTSINRFVCARSGERTVRTLNEAVHLHDVQG